MEKISRSSQTEEAKEIDHPIARSITGNPPMTVDRRIFWYKRFRTAAYFNTCGAILWTLIIVIPANPFSDIPPIIVGGGPGVWFLLAYLLYLIIGVGGFGSISTFLFAIETYERRSLNRRIIQPGFFLLNIGLIASTVLLAAGGVAGGLAVTINGGSQSAASGLLEPYVYPITTAVVIAAIGAALTILSMVRAKAQ